MARPRRLLVDPAQPQSMVDMIDELTRVLELQTSFGNPQDPDERDMSSSTLAGTAAANHPGTLENIEGSWVEVEVGTDQLDTAINCHHNLNVPVVSTSTPNVRWIPFMFQHDGEPGSRFSDLQVNLGAIRITAAAPAVFAVNANAADPFDATLPLLWFSQGDNAYFQVELPDSWRDATAVELHLHWTADIAAGADEAVSWEVSYSWANEGATFPAVSAIYNNATDGEATATAQGTRLAQDTHYVSVLNDDGAGNLASITTTSKEHDSIMIGRITREAGAPDDYAGEAGLMTIDFHIEHDKLGSDGLASETAGMGTWNQNFGVHYDPGDTVETNMIPLRFNASDFVKVDDSHKLKVSLFFIPAIQ